MRTHIPQTRDEMIEQYLPLARKLARRYARSADSIDDLEQVAALALVKAVDRFDPARGKPFSSFAAPTILGELKRWFRDTRWAVHMPRDLQERAQRVAREADRLTSELGRAPTARDVATALGTSVEDVLEARDAFAALDAGSLDAPVEGAEHGDALGELIGGPDAGYELAEVRASVAPAIARLPARERAALSLRFGRDMTQAEIGAELGISQMQVSRILRRSLSRVRDAAGSAPEAARASRADHRGAARSGGRARGSACPPRRAA